jgi:hypothetical protein
MGTLLLVMKLVPVVIVYRFFTLLVLIVDLFRLCSFFAFFLIVFSFRCMVIIFPSVIIDGVRFVVAKRWCRSRRRLGRGSRLGIMMIVIVVGCRVL